MIPDPALNSHSMLVGVDRWQRGPLCRSLTNNAIGSRPHLATVSWPSATAPVLIPPRCLVALKQASLRPDIITFADLSAEQPPTLEVLA
jgi:hypothetical protein